MIIEFFNELTSLIFHFTQAFILAYRPYLIGIGILVLIVTIWTSREEIKADIKRLTGIAQRKTGGKQ